MARPNLADRITSDLLNRLQGREITTTQAARELGVSLTHLSRTLANVGFHKDPSEAVEGRKLAAIDFAERMEERKTLAEQIKFGRISFQQACEQANCSPRTMFRYLKKAGTA